MWRRIFGGLGVGCGGGGGQGGVDCVEVGRITLVLLMIVP